MQLIIKTTVSAENVIFLQQDRDRAMILLFNNKPKERLGCIDLQIFLTKGHYFNSWRTQPLIFVFKL
jgi:hypothetical protein